jgi:hypothetical protein
MTPDKFKDGIQWWMDTKTYGACPNPPQWHINTGNLVRLVPQRPWVGLTDEEIDAMWIEWKDAVCLDHKTWAQAIQAKVKEKNNG